MLNFGMDSTGVVQFAGIYDERMRAFEPDLVLINFIDQDMMRRFIWCDTLHLRLYTQVNPYFSSEEEGLASSQAVVEAIKAEQANVILVHNPNFAAPP